MDRLLDEARFGPLFLKQPEVSGEVLAVLQDCAEGGRCELHAWVIMPNHVHLLLTPKTQVSRLLQMLKGRSARRANRVLSRTGKPFWQDESFDRVVRNDKEFERIRGYIEGNPVTAGLVHAAEEYRWSSAWRD